MSTASKRFPRLARLTRSPYVWVAVMVVAGFVMYHRPKAALMRGVTLLGSPTAAPASPAQTTGLFVGVQQFTSTPPPDDVRYAVDDAVDLATAFAGRVIEPTRIVLALSGTPVKKSSVAALEKLRSSGARVVEATKEKIERSLEEQTKEAGSGELIVSFATHGFSEDGSAYVLASGSSFEEPGSAISTASVLETASSAGRSFVVLDACRERISSARARRHRVDTRAPLLEKMRRYHGQVVFAPAAGKYTYDGERNGIFTEAIIDGMQQAKCSDGYVTVPALQAFVETRVRHWLKHHHHDDSPPAIQVNSDGEGVLALASCRPPIEMARVTRTSSSIDAFDAAEKHLWGKRFESAVFDAQLAKTDDVAVALIGHRVVAFDNTGNELWSDDLGPHWWPDKLLVDRWLRGVKHSEVLVVARGDGGSRISLYDIDGTSRGAYEHPDRFVDVLPVRETSHHGWRVVAASATSVLMFEPKELADAVWRGVVRPRANAIRHIATGDRDGDGHFDLAVTLASGKTLYVDFEGHRIGGAGDGDEGFELVAP